MQRYKNFITLRIGVSGVRCKNRATDGSAGPTGLTDGKPLLSSGGQRQAADEVGPGRWNGVGEEELDPERERRGNLEEKISRCYTERTYRHRQSGAKLAKTLPVGVRNKAICPFSGTIGQSLVPNAACRCHVISLYDY